MEDNGTLPVNRWVILCSGFLQDEGQLTGMVSLWRKIAVACHDEQTVVELRPWHTSKQSWGELAEKIWRFRPSGQRPRVVIATYSWGVNGGLTLARELLKRGITVNNFVSSDGVYRHGYFLGQWRALVPWSRIKVPRNVQVLDCYRQTNNLPKGHLFVAESDYSTVKDCVVIDRTHQYMDDAEEFHAKAVRTSVI